MNSGSKGSDSGLLLGKQVPVADEYSPHLLYPIPRSTARAQLGIGGTLPFHGCDLWHAYELSWLDSAGKPQVRVGRFLIPADSPNMVESKSFKLYLNSLNNTRYPSDAAVADLLQADLGRVLGSVLTVEILPVDDPAFAGKTPGGLCLDSLDPGESAAAPDASLLACGTQVVEEQLYSHLLRSLCPVTGQPDWATLWIDYRGRAIDHASLLRYIVAFRRHQEYHEQCVERMFVDLNERLQPGKLSIQAFYTRRGGLDINPFRSTDATGTPRPRMNRQ
ncbi:NADPH-dependent 7-cyano-7-deazaguanine reductase QueF [Haliea sp. E17]|uniref:NADPH-dependent 7-cyano-7-deazaguanine reductase QueF n=1 Tax=Haliea sp. E17 TaxID=3401576 RepID=UPI003AACC599